MNFLINGILNILVNRSGKKVVNDERFKKIVKNQERIREIDKEIKEMQPQIKKLNDFLSKDDLTGTTNFEYIDKFLKKDYFNDENNNK